MTDPQGMGLANWANLITVARMFLAPLLFAVMARGAVSWVTWSLWVVLSVSDLVDGWIARRYGTTKAGAFLDPLADKILVLGAMAMLVAVDSWPLLPVLLIGARELIISLYRTQVGRRGVSIPARPLAKRKTFLQMCAVGFALWPWTADIDWLAMSFLWASVVLAMVSGAQYLLDGRRAAMARPRLVGEADAA